MLSCQEGGCICFRRTQRGGRDVGSESVLNGEETEECFPVGVPSCAHDVSSSVSMVMDGNCLGEAYDSDLGLMIAIYLIQTV